MKEKQQKGAGSEQETGQADLEQKATGSEQNTGLPVVEQGSRDQTQKHGLSRRQFLLASAVVGGVAGTGLLIGFRVFGEQNNGRAGISATSASNASFAPNIWIRIGSDNITTIWVGKSEMGQGVLTALSMLVAEELDADWTTVRVEQAPADKQYGEQKTDGSSSISASFYAMRNAGAGARAFLIAAAAKIWKVNQAACRTEKSTVVHVPDNKRLSYGELVEIASQLKLSQPTLVWSGARRKDTGQLTLIGTRVLRVDTPQKIDGSAMFGLDVRVPGMYYATIARCPILGGSLDHFDSTRARAVPGVLQILPMKSGLAVVAKNTWAAIQGRLALEIVWKPGPNAHIDSAHLRTQLVAETQCLVGTIDQGPNAMLTATYETPFLAHATMEPMNCTAYVQKTRCEVWAPTQHPQAAQQVAATASGLTLEAVTLHVTLMGGGFGRRVETDFVAEAVQISQAIGKPVQVVWTREDDLQHDFYRPASYQQLSTNLTTHGLPSTWTHIVTTQDTDRDDHQSETATDGADLPYTIASPHITGSQISSAIPTGIWRSSNYSNTIFALESFIDEVAATGKLDPYQLRLQLLSNNPRLLAVTRLAASKAGWGNPLPAGWGRGMAICSYFTNAAVAEVAEVSLGSDSSVRVHRVICVVDCGLVVNPNIAEAQIEGAIVFGLTAALKGKITVTDGRIQQHTFSDYPLLRMNEMPVIEVYFIASTAEPYGLGEPGVPPIAPAIANAIFAATGRRIRRLPIQAADLR